MPDIENPLKGWHLRKEVTVGQIVTIATLAVSLVWYASTVETRLALLEREDRVLAHRMTTQEQNVTRSIDQVLVTLRRIEDKLDRKADK